MFPKCCSSFDLYELQSSDLSVKKDYQYVVHEKSVINLEIYSDLKTKFGRCVSNVLISFLYGHSDFCIHPLVVKGRDKKNTVIYKLDPILSSSIKKKKEQHRKTLE